MKQRTVLIAGLIGLVFGFLLTATLGISFFPDDTYEEPNNQQNNDDTMLDKDAAAFEAAYNLTDSIYEPITGDMAQEKIDNDETFILYVGFSACPYCQQYVPVLMSAAKNQNVDMIYHVDTKDDLNRDFVNDLNLSQTPTTYIYKDGVLVETINGYLSLSNTEQVIIDYIN